MRCDLVARCRYLDYIIFTSDSTEWKSPNAHSKRLFHLVHNSHWRWMKQRTFLWSQYIWCTIDYSRSLEWNWMLFDSNLSVSQRALWMKCFNQNPWVIRDLFIATRTICWRQEAIDCNVFFVWSHLRHAVLWFMFDALRSSIPKNACK